MLSAELFIYGFFGLILILAIGTAIHARNVDPPLENEEYLAENPELRELKQQMEDEQE